MALNKTRIEWVKNPDGSPGYTFNPLTGCLNHINGLCKGGGFPCYAYRLAHGRLKHLYLANLNLPPLAKGGMRTEGNKGVWAGDFADPFYPHFWEDRLFAPYMQMGKPRGIFTCDMSDLFGIGIPEIWTQKVLHQIQICKRHRFYLLTKQPQNLINFSPFPDNVYLGVTVCNQEMFNKAIHYLKMVDAKVKFLSMEPLMERINIDL